MDTAGLAWRERLLAELEEVVLSGVALPPVGGDPRSIDPSRGMVVGRAGDRACGNRLPRAIGVLAIHRAGKRQVRRKRIGLVGIGQVGRDGGISAGLRRSRI